MTLKTIFRFGLPLSFVYCTVYQQDVWREGDQRLVEEQKKVWREFFQAIDNTYYKLVDGREGKPGERRGIIPKFSVQCWNSKVRNTFETVELVISKPSYAACRLYRKIQPYISSEKPVSPHAMGVSGQISESK